MILTSLRTCSLSSDGLAWYERFSSAAESGDYDTFASLLDSECAYQVNSFLPFYGRDTVVMALQRFRATFESMEVEPINIFGTDLHFAVEVLHHYTRKDGAVITVPASAFIDRTGAGALASARLYIDLSRLIAEQS